VLENTSINETKTAAIIPKEWPASNVGAPYSRGYVIFILHQHVQELVFS
jgi:hypothetical protein